MTLVSEINLTLNSQKTPHKLLVKVGYEVFIVSSLVKTGHIITSPGCLWETHMTEAGIILCTCAANERRRYNVTSSLIGWAHTQNDPCWGCDPGYNSLTWPLSLTTLSVMNAKITVIRAAIFSDPVWPQYQLPTMQTPMGNCPLLGLICLMQKKMNQWIIMDVFFFIVFDYVLHIS